MNTCLTAVVSPTMSRCFGLTKLACIALTGSFCAVATHLFADPSVLVLDAANPVATFSGTITLPPTINARGDTSYWPPSLYIIDTATDATLTLEFGGSLTLSGISLSGSSSSLLTITGEGRGLTFLNQGSIIASTGTLALAVAANDTVINQGDISLIGATVNIGAGTFTNTATGRINVGSTTANTASTLNYSYDSTLPTNIVFQTGSTTSGTSTTYFNSNLTLNGVDAARSLIFAAGSFITQQGDGYAYLNVGNNAQVNNAGSISLSKGSISITSGSLTNSGSITLANGSLTTSLWGDSTTTGTFTNTASGTLSLGGGYSTNIGSFTNAGVITLTSGWLVNAVGSKPDASGTRISYPGTFTNTATGTITVSPSGTSSAWLQNYSNLVNDGTIKIAGGNLDNSTAYWSGGIVGTFTNNGTIAINAGGFSNSAILTNSGQIGVAQGALLTNASGGQILMSAGQIRNAGTFRNSGAITITGGGFLNEASGSLQVTSGTFRSTGTVTNQGNVYIDNNATDVSVTNYSQISGLTRVNGTLGGGTVSIAGGALAGSGLITSDVTIGQGAHLAPGSEGAGTLTIGGNLTFVSGAVLDFDVGTVSDLLQISTGGVTGPTGIGGLTLNISAQEGFGVGSYDLIKGTSFSDFDAGDFVLGTTPVGSFLYSLAFDNSTLTLNVVAVAASPVPEPSTYAVLAGFGTLLLAVFRTRIRMGANAKTAEDLLD